MMVSNPIRLNPTGKNWPTFRDFGCKTGISPHRYIQLLVLGKSIDAGREAGEHKIFTTAAQQRPIVNSLSRTLASDNQSRLIIIF
jgi:hypothetical protein